MSAPEEKPKWSTRVEAMDPDFVEKAKEVSDYSVRNGGAPIPPEIYAWVLAATRNLLVGSDK